MKQISITFLLMLMTLLGQKAFAQCSTSSTPSHNCSYGDQIRSFTLNSIATSGNSGCSSSGYGFFSTSRSLNIGSTYSFSATYGTSSYAQGFAIFIDLNANNIYETSERLYISPSTGQSSSGTITIPTTATAGTVRMRTMCRYASTTLTDACASYTYGEVEDYNVTLVGATPCSGTPSPGNTIASANPVCSGSTVNLSLQNATSGTGVTYQWQSSSNGTTWTNVSSGGTSSTYSPTVSSNTYYRCQVTCSGNTGTSNSLLVTTSFFACYCAAANTSGCTFGDNISNVTLGSLNNSSGCVGGSPAYISYIGSVTAPTLNIGSTNSISVSVGSGGTEHVGVWIDYNHSGTFETSEFTYIGTRTSAGAITNSIAIPPTALTGSTAMRVRVRWGSSGVSATEACTTFSYGETEDYEVNLVCPAITISTQPSNVTMCPGGNTSFTVAAAAGATALTASYQWQVNTGSGWSNVTNTGVYSGATTATLTLTGAPNTMAGYQYRCVATNDCSNNVTSNAATLSFYNPPVIAASPTNQNGCPNGVATFTTSVTGTNLSYQWQINTGSGWSNLSTGTNYASVTSPNLVITNISTGMNNYQYRCVISNPCVVTTSAATLSVLSVPSISAQSGDVTICTGANTTFTVTASGTAIAYQWQVNSGSTWNNITNTGVYSGATSSALTITGATVGMHNNKYRCLVSGTCSPTAISTFATLFIGANAAITKDPTSLTACSGTTSSMNITATGFTLSYQWQVSTNSGGSWSNVSNSAFYSGATTNTLTFTSTSLTLNGNMYRCVATNTCGNSATSAAATLSVATSPVVTTQPTNKILCVGDNTTFSCVATSSSTIAYQWQYSANGTTWLNVSNGGVYSGATTPTLTLTNVDASLNIRYYRCELYTGCVPATTTNTASLEVRTSPVLDYSPTNVTICQGQSAAFATNATGSLLNFQWQVSTNGGSSWSNVANGGIYSGATSKVLTVTNAPTSVNGYRYRCSISGYCAPVITSGSAILTVNTPVVITSQPTSSITICSGDNASYTVGATGTGLSYKWYRYNGTAYVQINNGGVYSGATTSTLNITGMTAPTTTVTNSYHCIVTGTCNTASTNTLNLTVHARPTITSNPSSVTVCDSTQYVDFVAAATGTNISYQWQLNTGSAWVNISNNATYSGATTAQLRVAMALYAMNGYQYRCVVSGTCSPQATTSVATLNVNQLQAPSVTITGNTDLCQGQSTTLTAVAVNGGSSPSFQWTKNNVVVGTGSTYTYGSYNDHDYVQVRLTSSLACPSPKTVFSAQQTIFVTQYVEPKIFISSVLGDSACTGRPATFLVDSIQNGGSSPSYQWRINGQNVGTNSTTFTTTALQNGDVVTCQLTSSLKCLAPAIGTSNALPMIVNPTRGSGISISVTPDSVICQHSEVLIYSSFQIGGTNPTLQWMRNGVDIPGEVGGKLRISTLNHNDVISCKFFSTAVCVFPDTSNEIKFDVTPEVVPSVNVQVSYSGGNTYTFTATPSNGGANPAYQWFKNFTAINGATNSSYTADDLVNSDVIHVEMTSSADCPKPSEVPALSRYVTTSVSEVKDIFDYLNVYPNPNSGTFTIKGDYNFNSNADVEIKVVNALGQSVYNANDKIRGGKLNHKINMDANVTPGVYIIYINADGNKDFRRFTVNK